MWRTEKFPDDHGADGLACSWQADWRSLPARCVMGLGLVLAIGCARSVPAPIHGPPMRQARPEPRASDIRQEFLAIAAAIKSSENPYLGKGQLARLEAETAPAGRGIETAVNRSLKIAWHRLRLGEFHAAHESIEHAFATVAMAAGQPTASMHKLRALIHLREAEFRNCVQRHNRDCCVLPLQGGGIHEEKEPVRRARSDLLAWLAVAPREIEAAWLLNIAAMALGDYPHAVPEAYRLPADAFASEARIGRFVDVAPALGVDTYNLCGGAITEDFNGDGNLDIVTSTYDPVGPLTYYESDGHAGYIDRSSSSGLDQQLGGLNCIAADYDNDGDMDILVLRGAWLGDDGRIRNSLLSNNGRGEFTDVTASAGLAFPAYPTQAAAWADFDNDGQLDLFIGNESRVELGDSGANFASQLFHNNGDKTFTDIAQAAGVTNDRYCKGVSAADYDNDGDIDLYVSNRGPNRLYQNQGDGTFLDVAVFAAVIEPQQQSFASWFFDYDNDGWLDLFVAAYQATNADVAADVWRLPHQGVSPCLYRNRGDGTFENVTEQVGLAHPYLPMGANFGDVDNDGFLDIYLTTGRPDFAALMPNVMLRNDGGRRFQNITTNGGFGHLQKGHGVAFADLDNDGDQDIYHQLGGFYPGDKYQNALFQNPGHGTHFLSLKLTGRVGHRQAIGARLRVRARTATGTIELHRAVGAVSSFGGSPIRQEIGLGAARQIESIQIIWPVSGTRQIVRDVPIDCFIEVVEGEDGFRLQRAAPISFDKSVKQSQSRI